MKFELDVFADAGLSGAFLDWLVGERAADVAMHFGKFWEYYVNRSEVLTHVSSGDNASVSGRCYVQAQEYGLPARITGVRRSGCGDVFEGQAVEDIERKEVVVENDIGWRVNAGVDFLFGRPVGFVSTSPDERKRAQIEGIVKALFFANGGVGFMQDMAVLGSVYGFVDCVVRPGREILERFTSNVTSVSNVEDVLRYARAIELELVEAPRALPILDEDDYRRIRYYVQHFVQRRNAVSQSGSFLSRLLKGQGSSRDERETVRVTEVLGPKAWQRYENEELVAEGEFAWGFLPVVHIQNLAQPFYYEGVSDVEALIPLQDELNTRLSDRASRITFQAFKMYLAKGIEGFGERSVSPGRMWCTDNPDATVEEFGGDSASQSEEMHIAEIREAMDKASSVTPLVAGVLRDRVGNLTSAVALRLTLMGMLSKTERKRFTYGEGLKRIGAMVLEILDAAGIYRTSEADRGLEVMFESPLPENTTEQLQQAQMKKELGVSSEQVLKELGYETEG